jgi:hypothetical protein
MWSFYNTDTTHAISWRETEISQTASVRTASVPAVKRALEYKSRAMPVRRVCAVSPYLIISTILFAKWNGSSGKVSNFWEGWLVRITAEISTITTDNFRSFHQSPEVHAEILLSRDGVNLDWFWIHDRIYQTLWYSAWLHFTVHYHTHTHTLVSTVTLSLAVAQQGFPTEDVPLLLGSRNIPGLGYSNSRLILDLLCL